MFALKKMTKEMHMMKCWPWWSSSTTATQSAIRFLRSGWSRPLRTQ